MSCTVGQDFSCPSTHQVPWWLQDWAASLEMNLPDTTLSSLWLQARSQLRRVHWTTVTLGAGCAVLGALLVSTMHQNARLQKLMRTRDKELAKLAMHAWQWQHKVEGGRIVPIIRHTHCGFTAYSAAELL